ncbi:unnamed protein product [Polarella glacialis]|uniref:Acyl-[acyl-carrier-protein] hydrolase n=2 Tax=Polarella glacialis TaxID=89957 RepID=A0A813LVJ1_POLGL|nr:unnamed protein product [Polarella glacialis]
MSMEIVAQYMDFSAHNSLAAVLRWSDTGQMALLMGVSDKSVRYGLKESWERASVMRLNKVEMLVSGPAWEKVFTEGTALAAANSSHGEAYAGMRVHVVPTLACVGRTSWTVLSDVRTKDGVGLAKVETVMVLLDAGTLSTPVPLLHSSVLQSLVVEGFSPNVPAVCDQPAGAFVWQTQVRPSDCDLLGHMNNVCYAMLMEDACGAAAACGALPVAGTGCGVRLAAVEYLGQAKALERLDVALWWDQLAGAFGLRVSAVPHGGKERKDGEGRVVATGVIAPWAQARL